MTTPEIADQAVVFLTALGLKVSGGVQSVSDTRVNVNVVETSFWSLYNRSPSFNSITIGNVVLKKLTSVHRRVFDYEVWRKEDGVETKLGKMGVFIRPVSKECLITLEPAK
jgi:hypothetical protein